MPAADVLNQVNDGPFGAKVTNVSAVHKVGKTSVDAAGKRDALDSDSQATNGSSMFGEGSVGKIRFAGLAHMLQQSGIMNLQQNAKEFFGSEKTGEFLEKKYPGQGADLQAGIVGLFVGDSQAATLADLTTHRSGIGDLTRDQAGLFSTKEMEHEYTVLELLSAPRVTPASPDGRPKVQSAPDPMPDAKYGAHQYSNLGYMLLGLAMEASYDAARNPTGEKDIKDYPQLLQDFMLHPIEGRADKRGLSFDETKFPSQLDASDNVARGSWIQGDKLVDTSQFSGANAAGGIFTSADDSTEFFGNFFRGFPGTPEAGQDVNPFFSQETIGAMMEEGRKFGNCGINNSPNPERNGNERFQGPGFSFEIGKDGNPLSFEKGGKTFGSVAFLSVDAKTGQATIDMFSQENVTGEIAKRSNVPVKDVMDKYRDSESGEFDRRAMMENEIPDVIKHSDISGALQKASEALEENGASMADDVAASAKHVPKVPAAFQDNGRK
jgi:CubicO group peptidase (beta-lactamase class C family)